MDEGRTRCLGCGKEIEGPKKTCDQKCWGKYLGTTYTKDAVAKSTASRRATIKDEFERLSKPQVYRRGRMAGYMAGRSKYHYTAFLRTLRGLLQETLDAGNPRAASTLESPSPSRL